MGNPEPMLSKNFLREHNDATQPLDAIGAAEAAARCARIAQDRRSAPGAGVGGMGEGSALHVMLALHRSSRQVVVTDEEFDSTDMIGELLGKRQRVAHQP